MSEDTFTTNKINNFVFTPSFFHFELNQKISPFTKRKTYRKSIWIQPQPYTT